MKRNNGVFVQTAKDEFLVKLKEKNPNIFKLILDVLEFEGGGKQCIIKTKYGDVRVLPSNLYRAKGFSIESAIDKNDFFINKSREIWGDKYDYSETYYNGAKNPINIICKIHGLVEVRTANAHISKGSGCKYCVIENKKNDFNHVKSVFKERGLKLLICKSEYKNKEKPMPVEHFEFGYKAMVSYSNVSSSNFISVDFFNKRNPFTIENIKIFISKII